jgi:hypothetical protein
MGKKQSQEGATFWNVNHLYMQSGWMSYPAIKTSPYREAISDAVAAFESLLLDKHSLIHPRKPQVIFF